MPVHWGKKPVLSNNFQRGRECEHQLFFYAMLRQVVAELEMEHKHKLVHVNHHMNMSDNEQIWYSTQERASNQIIR